MAAPIKSIQLRLAYSQLKIDLSVWEGKAREGKPLASSLSIKFIDLPDPSKPVGYLDIEDALNVANVIQHLAFFAQEHDSKRRIEAWKIRNENEASNTTSEEPLKPANE